MSKKLLFNFTVESIETAVRLVEKVLKEIKQSIIN